MASVMAANPVATATATAAANPVATAAVAPVAPVAQVVDADVPHDAELEERYTQLENAIREGDDVCADGWTSTVKTLVWEGEGAVMKTVSFGDTTDEFLVYVNLCAWHAKQEEKEERRRPAAAAAPRKEPTVRKSGEGRTAICAWTEAVTATTDKDDVGDRLYGQSTSRIICTLRATPPTGFARVHAYAKTRRKIHPYWSVKEHLVMQRLGRNLWRATPTHRLSLKTALFVADQMLQRLSVFHTATGHCHGSTKPLNWMHGAPHDAADVRTIYLIDFGNTRGKTFRTMWDAGVSSDHTWYRTYVHGTYMDDVFASMLTLLLLLTGTIPWTRMPETDDMEDIMLHRVDTRARWRADLADLPPSVPPRLAAVVEYARRHGSHRDAPHYDCMRRMLRECADHHHLAWDGSLDWATDPVLNVDDVVGSTPVNAESATCTCLSPYLWAAKRAAARRCARDLVRTAFTAALPSFYGL